MKFRHTPLSSPGRNLVHEAGGRVKVKDMMDTDP